MAKEGKKGLRGCCQIDQVRKEGGRVGVREGAVRWWERKIIYPNYYYHFTTTCPLSVHCFILRSLAPLWVMSGGNWRILLTFPALHFYMRVICMHASAPQVLAQVMYITIFFLIRSSSESTLNNVLLCNVTNRANLVREEDMGNNGV